MKLTPFENIYDRKPPTILVHTRDSTSLQAFVNTLQSHTDLLRVLKENLLDVQHRMTQHANAHCHQLNFPIGDLILVHLKTYQQPTVRQCYNELSKKYYGSYHILERIGPIAYKL